MKPRLLRVACLAMATSAMLSAPVLAQDAETTADTDAPRGMFVLDVGTSGYRGFDRLVMADYVKAAGGDSAALERLLGACAEAIEVDAENAEALAWRGAARMFEAGAASDSGDMMAAMTHVNKALADLARAGSLEMDNPGVRIIAAQTLLVLAQNHPIEQMAKGYATQGIEHATAGLASLHGNWGAQPIALKGRLMSDVAAAHERLGEPNKARDWYNRVIGAVPGSVWAQQAQAKIDAMDAAADREARSL